MGIPTEVAILDALSDDDETIDSGIKNSLNFFKIDITDDMLIKTLNEMLKKELIYIVFVEDESADNIFRTWFGRTNKGTNIWEDFAWQEYEDFINARNIELYGS